MKAFRKTERGEKPGESKSEGENAECISFLLLCRAAGFAAGGAAGRATESRAGRSGPPLGGPVCREEATVASARFLLSTTTQPQMQGCFREHAGEQPHCLIITASPPWATG